MNNKGFAISTLIYGLSIMGIMLVAILLGVMSNIRSNSKEITKDIEDELVLYGRTEKSFDDTSKEQVYIVPDGESGWYRIELWGAQGGNESNRAYGAYTSGVIKLLEGDTLYFYIGKRDDSHGPGESTDVRLVGGNYNEKTSYDTRIMVAAGGGTGAYAVGGTIAAYSRDSIALGGYVQNNGTFDANASKNNLMGYATGYQISENMSGFIAGPISENNGGSGYYSSKDAKFGGTSYIAGYPGSGEAYVDFDGYKYYFIDGNMFAGVNKGTGKAKITKVLDYDEESGHTNLRRINTKLNGVKFIRDCLKIDGGKNNNTPVSVDTFSRIVAMREGKMVSGTLGTALENGGGNYKCRVLTLSNVTDLDEIAVWHTPKGRDYFNHRVEVKGDTGSWIAVITDNNSTRSMTDTAVGHHISAYQPDATSRLPSNGNYHILPVLDENKAVTSQKEILANPLFTSFINGEKTQMWSIEEIDDKLKTNPSAVEYKIVDLAHYNAMKLKDGQNRAGNSVVADEKFNNSSRVESQIWKVEPVNDGTFAIVSVVPKADNSVDSGYMVSKKNSSNTTMIIGKKDLDCQKFRLISLEYHHST